ncbi:hypothetical protein J4573_44680 [Actinomadura barringtoniae]|uniref:Uncharacterized protein n=1 Tax=Actinomadura barringtoniae TaxID=1427535 RepID=A0A939PSF4_9ACTN|nr:hypothetical protein [Actinomadura barringtoniae]MBO2454249.1 hypothetical protein [Actinomadura barringtoniae]
MSEAATPSQVFMYHPPRSPAAYRQIVLYNTAGKKPVHAGRLVWQLCERCRQGSVYEISVGKGTRLDHFGRRAIKRALRDGPSFTWSMTQETAAIETLREVAADLGVAFAADLDGCRHIRAGRDGDPSDPESWDGPRPRLEREI